MTRRPRHVTTCPDCGGILQSVAPEPLTSADVQAGPSAAPPAARRQCLICGYEEAPRPDAELVASL